MPGAKEKRLFFVTLVLEPIEGAVGDNIRGISSDIFSSLFSEKQWVVIRTLTAEHFPGIKSSGAAF